MAKSKKKTAKFTADSIGTTEVQTQQQQAFYFTRENYKWMLIGLAMIVLGFILMMGPDANTVDGKFDPNNWNEGIFSIRRIRIAPLMVIAGFAVHVYAILKRTK